MKTLALCLTVALAAPAVASAQADRLDSARRAAVAGVFEDLLRESPPNFMRDAGGYSGIAQQNRLVSGFTLPRATRYPGVCAVDGYTIAALPERDRGPPAPPHGVGSPIIRQIEADTRYLVVELEPSKTTSFAERDRQCAALAAEEPLSSAWGRRTEDFFPASDEAAAKKAQDMLRWLATEGRSGDSWSPLVTCRRGGCPDAKRAALVLRPEAIVSIREQPVCRRKEHACYRLMLTSGFEEPGLWIVAFSVPFGVHGKPVFHDVSFTPEAMVSLGDDVIE